VDTERSQGVLGKSTADRFSNQLPFLFKVLAAAKPLSIQAHPTMKQARNGFARENEQGVPVDAPHRNYRDAFHKPEIICALTTFWGLNGFRRTEEILLMMKRLSTPELEKTLAVLEESPNPKGIKEFLRSLLTMDQKTRRQVIASVVPLAKANAHEDHAFKWISRLNEEYPDDIGILFPVVLNLIQLQPGEAMFLNAGDLHAYLEGVGIELMANSDNVLRGGLTPKHVDVQELLRILTFAEKKVEILQPTPLREGEKAYLTPAQEFLLSVISISENIPYISAAKRNVEIMLCTEGRATIANLEGENAFSLNQGDSVIVPSSAEQYKIQGNACIYKAGAP
jgi:mannose-6-phosphate isomerase